MLKSDCIKSLEVIRVLEKTECSTMLEFSVPASSPYYDGHFPGFPILPAVAQTEIVLRFADEYLGTGINVSEIRRIKFSNFLLPDKPHLLRFNKSDTILSFKITSLSGDTVFSQGSFILSEGL